MVFFGLILAVVGDSLSIRQTVARKSLGACCSSTILLVRRDRRSVRPLHPWNLPAILTIENLPAIENSTQVAAGCGRSLRLRPLRCTWKFDTQAPTSHESSSWTEHRAERLDRLLLRGRAVPARPTPGWPRPRWFGRSDRSSDRRRRTGARPCATGSRLEPPRPANATSSPARNRASAGAWGLMDRLVAGQARGNSVQQRATPVRAASHRFPSGGADRDASPARLGVHGRRGQRDDRGCRAAGLRLDRPCRLALAGQSRRAAAQGISPLAGAVLRTPTIR